MQYLRNINSTTTTDFQIKVSYDTWDNIFQGSNVNIIFNKFLNTYLRIFYFSLIKKRITFNHKYNPWITTRTRILCNKKRGLYMKYRVSNDNNLKLYYEQYCTILSKVIRAVKKLHYDKMNLNSKNKMETTWKITETETGKTNHTLGVRSLKINNTVMDNHIINVNTFNKYFVSVQYAFISSVKSGNNMHRNNTKPI